MKQKLKGGNISQIKEELKRRLIVMRYSEVTTGVYMRIFGWVEDFLECYGETNYSKEMGQKFLTEYTMQPKHAPIQYRNAKTVIRRIDEILENKLFQPRFTNSKPECPPQFAVWCEKYFSYLHQRGNKEGTIENHRRYVTQLLSQLTEVKSFKKLTATDLYDIFKKNESQPIASFSVIRSLLTFLFDNGVTKIDLSICVPNPRRPRPFPSIYKTEEVTQLLTSVDRTNAKGKRDYAILMLAARLGLRSSDIVNLSFNNIDYGNKIISIVQVKTSHPLTLVLNADVEEAIVDYIENGRPTSTSDKIFLGTKAPFAPLHPGTGHAIAQRSFERAGISAQGRKRGTHALRSSYATALISKNIPYAIVQEALGHDDPESAKYYVRVDIKRLRTCAINVPKPTGALAVVLGDLEGVL